MKKIFTILSAMLLSAGAFAQTFNGGTWYSVYAEDEITNIVVTTTIGEWDVFAPAAGTVTFDYKKYQFLSINGKVKVEQSEDGSNYSEVGSVDYSDYRNYTEGSVSGMSSDIKKMKFTNTSTGVQVKNVKLPLAKHILLSGGDFGKKNVTKTFVNEVKYGESASIRADFRSFLTNGDITISVTEGDAEVFRLGSAENTSGVLETSTAGNSYAVGANACASANGTANACANGQLAKIGNYSFDIYFCPKEVGEATATITITDGTSTATISVKGTGVKGDQVEAPVELSFCAGDVAHFRDNDYDAAGDYTYLAESARQDTLFTIHVTELQPSASEESKTIVYGAEETWNEVDLSTYTVGDHVVIFTTANAVGCDSVVTLHLTVTKQQTLEVPVKVEFCEGGFAEFHGKEYTEAGEDVIHAEGSIRDTTYTVTIVELKKSYFEETLTITYGDRASWNGAALSDSAVGVHTMYYTTVNAVGCDSVVMLTLTVNKQQTLEDTVELAFCEGGSEEFHGEEYTEAGEYEVPTEGEIRDTLYTVIVTVWEKGYEEIQLTDTVGNTIALPEGEWLLGEDMLSGSYELQEADTVGVEFVQFSETEHGCEAETKLIVTVVARPMSEGVERVTVDKAAEKFFHNGVMYIRRGDAIYSATGERVE